MRVLIAALTLVAVIAPTPARANAELVPQILAVFEAEALVSAPDAAREAKNVDDLVRALRTVDPYLEVKPLIQTSLPTTAANSRSLGLVISTLGEGVLVMPVKSGPAFAAGLKDPAYLLTVNSQPVDGISADAIRALVSNGGAPVELRMATGTDAMPLTLRLESAPVAYRSVEMLRSGPVKVLRVHEFIAGETRRLLSDGLGAVEETTKAVVLDLRLNPGGSLYEALDAASLFLRPGLPVAGIRDRKGNTLILRAIETTSTKVELPLALLVSDHTASAAESFTRALQWHNRAVVAGRATFGKCLSQKMFPLTGGGSVLISNLVLLGPDGQDCGKAAVTPDLPVWGAAILDTEALIEHALARLGDKDQPTVVCLKEWLRSDPARTAAEELAVLFPKLPQPVLLQNVGGDTFRRCVGPFQHEEETAAWRERLRSGLERSSAEGIDLEEVPYRSDIAPPRDPQSIE